MPRRPATIQIPIPPSKTCSTRLRKRDKRRMATPGLTADTSGIVDGGIDAAEPIEGTEPAAREARDGNDVALFDGPPAGYDPLLFQIEDLNPYVDNRTTKRLFRQEPYDPVGIKVGSFVLFPEVEFGASYYSNVFTRPARRPTGRWM